jgi:hypothetical protein
MSGWVGPRAMRAAERAASLRLTAALALRAEPTLVRADQLAAIGTMFELGQGRGLGHSPRLSAEKRFGNTGSGGLSGMLMTGIDPLRT